MADNIIFSEEKTKNLLQRMATKEFWQNQNNWLFVLIAILITTVIIYITTHSLDKYSEGSKNKYWDDPHEAEFKKMDASDISYLTSLINQGSTYIDPGARPNKNAAEDSTEISTNTGTLNIHFKDNPNCVAVKEYIKMQLPYVYPQDTQKLFPLLEKQPNSLAVMFIQSAKFRVKSYFWLAGPHTYFEIIFWTIFGVITSILFYIAVAISNGTGFRSEEIPGHMAKIAYSPFISLIIIFAYNYIANSDSMVDVSASKSTLIISFLLGFYSSRAMKLLDKLKDVFLPYGETTTADDKNRKADIESNEAAQGSPVTVDINLNDPSHPDAEELNAQIAQTVVTLSPQNGGAPIPLEKTGEDELEGLFTNTNVPDGAYTITAHLTTSDGSNYSGTQEVQVTNGENTFTLALTKADVSG